MDQTVIVKNIGNQQNNDFKLEFQQLIAYYNFRLHFKEKLEKENSEKYDNQKYYLIDKKWLKTWKLHVGYNEICQERSDKGKYLTELNNNDYNDILPYLKIFCNKNTIFPLVNKDIYNKGVINPISDFIVVDKNCYDIFIIPNYSSDKEKNSFSILFFKENFLLKINPTQFLLSYKAVTKDKDGNEKGSYWELVLTILENCDETFIINHFTGLENILDWLKKMDFDLNSTEEKGVDIFGNNIKIVNKTLLNNKRKDLLNIINPQLNNGLNQTMKALNNITEEVKLQMVNEVTQIQKNFSKDISYSTGYNVNKVIGNKNSHIINNNIKSNNINKNIPNNNIMNNNFPNNNNIMNNNIPNNNNIMNNNIPNNNIIMNNNFPNNNIMNNNFPKNNFPNNNIILNNNIQNNNNIMNNNIQNNYIMNNNIQNNNIMNNNFPNNNIMNNNIQNNNIMNNYAFNNQNNMPNLKVINPSTGKSGRDPKINLKYPHKTGLENVGQTCYMNSTIQCLSNIKDLSDYLISHFGKFDIEKQPLAVSFSSLVYNLFHTDKKYIAPELFKKIIGMLNPLFEGFHAADAKDLIFFLLEKLHQELNKLPNEPEQSNIDYAQLEKDSYDKDKMLKHFIKDYSEKNKSIISDTFYGTICSTMKCNKCNKIKYSFQTFNLLIFQLKNVKENRQKTLNNNNKYKLNIYDAFDNDNKEEKLDGENMIYCNFCKGLNPGIHQQTIYLLPKVLIIILNRGKNNQDFNEEFIFPKELDLSIENYVINKDLCKTNFYLQSVITHLGESGSGGHFIAYCRNGPNGDFLCYNDASVSKASVEDAMGSKISDKEYEKRTPYILVYYQMDAPKAK